MKMIPVDRDRLQELEEAIAHAEGNLDSAKEEVKFAKDALDEATSALRNYVRELVLPQKTPLFDGTVEVVDPKTGEIFS